MQVCVSFNPSKSYKWYQERIYKLEDEGHDQTDRDKALSLALTGGDERLATGIFFKDDRPSYEDSLPQIEKTPLVKQEIGSIEIDSLMAELV